jgi:GLPGLI family protein
MKILRFALLITFLAGTTIQGFCQKAFDEGTISYSMNLQSDNAQAQQMMAGSTLTVIVKKNLSLTKMQSSMMQMTSLTDAAADTALTLMSMMGKNYYANMDAKQLHDKYYADTANYKVQYTDETKTICGYTCHKAIMTTKDGNKLNCWYTTDLIPSSKLYHQYMQIKGVPLEFTTVNARGTMEITCTKVDLSPVSDASFHIDLTGAEPMPDFMKGMGK